MSWATTRGPISSASTSMKNRSLLLSARAMPSPSRTMHERVPSNDQECDSFELGRTYYLFHIGNGDERGYNWGRSVTACPEVLATFFAKISGKSCIASP